MPLLVIGVIALCYLPFLSVGWDVLGFLTHGYLEEEGLRSGSELWLLSLWRLLFGEHRGDVPGYAIVAVLILLAGGLAVARNPHRTMASTLGDTNNLLLLALLLLSPNYPWYFLVITPFLALSGAPQTWAVSIGALLLTREVDWDSDLPRMITKSLLFGGLLLAWAVVWWRGRVHRTANEGLAP
jgi:hypothetical protein